MCVHMCTYVDSKNNTYHPLLVLKTYVVVVVVACLGGGVIAVLFFLLAFRCEVFWIISLRSGTILENVIVMLG